MFRIEKDSTETKIVTSIVIAVLCRQDAELKFFAGQKISTAFQYKILRDLSLHSIDSTRASKLFTSEFSSCSTEEKRAFYSLQTQYTLYVELSNLLDGQARAIYF